MGLSYDDFWRMSLRECDLILSETLARRDDEIKVRRILQQELAQLVSYGVNDPKNMPDFTKEKGKAAADKMGEKEAEMRLRSFFVGAAVKSKG